MLHRNLPRYPWMELFHGWFLLDTSNLQEWSMVLVPQVPRFKRHTSHFWPETRKVLSKNTTCKWGKDLQQSWIDSHLTFAEATLLLKITYSLLTLKKLTSTAWVTFCWIPHPCDYQRHLMCFVDVFRPFRTLSFIWKTRSNQLSDNGQDSKRSRMYSYLERRWQETPNGSCHLKRPTSKTTKPRELTHHVGMEGMLWRCKKQVLGVNNGDV